MDQRLKILCIEDSAADFRLVGRHLQNHGLAADCHRVSSLEELQATLGNGHWDLVLSDYNVPTLKFEDTLDFLAPRLEELPLILVSGSIGEERAVSLLKQGVWDFILKDNLTRLVPAIEHGLREAAGRRARRKTEVALRESESRYRNLFEMESSAIFLVDYETKRFLDANPAALGLYGYSLEEILQLDAAAVSMEPEKTLRAIGNRETQIPIRWHRKKDGTAFPVEISGTFFPDQGRLVHAVAIRDITERYQAEQLVQAEAERLTAVLNAQREIASANLEYTAFLQFILECMSRLSGAEGASLEMADGDEMVYQAATGSAASFVGMRLQIAGSLSGLCMTSGRIMRSDDSETDPRVDREKCRSIGLRSMMLLPLRYDEHNFGALKLMSPRVAAFSEDTEKILGLMNEFLSATISGKRTEDSLSHSEANFRAMFETASIGMGQTDIATCRWLRVNRKFCEMTGYSAEELLARTVWDITYPADREIGRELFQSAVAANQPSYHVEKRYVHKNGSLIWANVNVSILWDASGNPLRTVAAIEDITARRLAEEERIRLSTVVEQASEAIVITGLDAKILYVNPAFERVTGYSRQEAIGKNPRFLQSGQHDADFFQRLWKTLARGEVWRGHFINKRKDGQLFEEEATISPVRDASGKIVSYMAINLDVTREVALENQFRQSQKLEAIGQLAGGVAHDFNNILAAIMMQAQLTGLTDGLPASAAEDLQQISVSCERAANLTRQLLLFSRKQVMQPRDLEFNAVVTNITKMLQRIIGENVVIHCQLHPKPLMTHADPGMLDQVLMNLAVNARDAMGGSGQLTIKTSSLVLDESSSRAHPDSVPGRYVCLSVADTGEGIPPEILSRIFEPFFTTKEQGKGTGLGLATVFGIVKQHRGWIEVHTELGKGTSFEVLLPACTSASDAMMDDQPEALGSPGSETILLAEDDFSVRKITVKLLENSGYTVLEAADGVEALALWEKNPGSVNLLLTDLLMPGGINGRDLFRKLHAVKPDLKVIYFSGYSADLVGHGEELHLGENFLQKPVSPNRLLELIRQQFNA